MGRAWMLALAMVVAACGTGGATADDGGVPEPNSTTTGTLSTTTTSAADPCEGEPFVIEDSGGRLVPGCQYRTDAFPFTFSISVDEERWLNIPIADPRVVLFGLDDSATGTANATLVFLALQGSGSAVESLEDALGVVEADAATPPEVTERPMLPVGGRNALSVDISAGEEAGIDPDRDECTPGGTVSWEPSDWGFQLLGTSVGTPGRDFGIPACAMSRMWVVELEGGVVTIVASARDQDRFDALMSAFDDLLQNSVIFGGGDG